MSGQVSAIAVDLKNDPSGNTVYLGSSSGGVWKSTNGLSAYPSFNPITDPSKSLSVGAIALDSRRNPPVIFVGTGAPDNSANISAYTGVGILASADGGRTWRRISSADRGKHPFSGMGFSSILIDPQNPRIMLASTGIGVDPNFPQYSVPQGSTAPEHFGIYRSTNAGEVWTRVMPVTDTDGIVPAHGDFHIELLFEPTNKIYFAAVSKSGLFVSRDQGAHWRQIRTRGLPAVDDMLRISLATRNGVLWALLLEPGVGSKDPPFFQLFESHDRGTTWKLTPVPSGMASKGNLMYVAAPPNSDSLLVAAEFLFRTDKISTPSPEWLNITHSLHSDQHAIAIASSTNWYVGNDGGAWATTKGGDAWTSLNDNLRTLEMFSADLASGSSGAMAGGAQDNGPLETGGSPEWQQLSVDDGMFAAADPAKPGAFFVEPQFGQISYTATPLATAVSVSNLNGGFLTPYEVLPTDSRLFAGVTGFGSFNFSRSRILLAGGQVLVSGKLVPVPILLAFNPDASTNNTVSVQLTTSINGLVQFIAPVPGDPTTAFVVASEPPGSCTPPSSTCSALFQLTNISFAGTANATQISGGPVNEVDVLGHLVVSPANPSRLYLLKVGFLDGQKVFRTDDAGKAWTNISGNLPNVPVNWITIDPANPDVIFLGSNIGAFVATDGGVVNEKWQKLGSGLPRVPVTQLKMLPGRKLLAATYGRNVWMLNISNNSAGKADLVPTFNCHKFTGQVAVTIKNVGQADAPASTTTLQFILGSKTSLLTLPIPAGGSADLAFDIQGKCQTGCRFSLTADSDHQIDESNETNNFLEGVCLQ
jgi:photosystem II stability/assembly factor-like uncharacterized protein